MRALAGLIISAFFMAATASAEPLNGPALITVSGAIAKTNRGPSDEFFDIYFNIQDVEFEEAAEFDRNRLEALGMQSIKASYEEWPGEMSFEGPLLSDLLNSIGANGNTVSVKALDGYTVEVPMADIKKYPVVLAIKANGKFLGIGGRGPAWLIFPRNDYEELAKEDDSNFVWAVYHIEVK